MPDDTWAHSTVAAPTASISCAAGATSPSASCLMLNLPPVASETNLRKISPAPKRRSSAAGKPDARRQLIEGESCARAGALTAAPAATAMAPPCLNRLRQDGFLPLRHAADDAAFPFGLIALLSETGQDFTGGEFVMTEQRPRQQSRPMVLPLQRGDAAVIAVAHRPVHGANGDYRATLRHAVSRVRSGERVGLSLPLDGLPAPP